MKVKYKIDWLCVTPCPNGVCDETGFEVRVGSIRCIKCKHFGGFYPEHMVVDCNYVED